MVKKLAMYQEIKKGSADELIVALNAEFQKMNSILKVAEEDDLVKLPIAYVRVENGKKFSQIYIAANEKRYLPDFWKEGVCLADGGTESLNELAKVLDCWLCNDITTKMLSDKFSFVKPNEKAIAFDENREVEYTWKHIQNDSTRSELKEFVDIAIKDKIVSKLFPFTSLNRLCFSRCTGYPYTHDTPMVIPIGNSKFEVRTGSNRLLGSGTAQDVLKILNDNLPLDIKPAIKGTAEDL